MISLLLLVIKSNFTAQPGYVGFCILQNGTIGFVEGDFITVDGYTLMPFLSLHIFCVNMGSDAPDIPFRIENFLCSKQNKIYLLYDISAHILRLVIGEGLFHGKAVYFKEKMCYHAVRFLPVHLILLPILCIGCSSIPKQGTFFQRSGLLTFCLTAIGLDAYTMERNEKMFGGLGKNPQNILYTFYLRMGSGAMENGKSARKT